MIIDADAHVEESEAMFDRLDKEFRPRRPLPVRLATDTVYGKYNAVWLIDGETYPKLVGKGGTIFRTPTLMEAASLKRESIGVQRADRRPGAACRHGSRRHRGAGRLSDLVP